MADVHKSAQVYIVNNLKILKTIILMQYEQKKKGNTLIRRIV